MMSTIDHATDNDLDPASRAYAQVVGERLRSIRRQKRMSLHDVERTSSQEFKASVLGAYERGERAISVPRLHRLAQFYRVPVAQLLPSEDRPADKELSVEALTAEQLTDASGLPKVVIDLARLDDVPGESAALLGRFLGMIQLQRQDFNGRMLTIRRADLGAVASILDVPLGGVVARLDELGLRYKP
jgi:transcriptional regulator with XRE-family HTH domain